jgi:hypothetical protein
MNLMRELVSDSLKSAASRNINMLYAGNRNSPAHSAKACVIATVEGSFVHQIIKPSEVAHSLIESEKIMARTRARKLGEINRQRSNRSVYDHLLATGERSVIGKYLLRQIEDRRIGPAVEKRFEINCAYLSPRSLLHAPQRVAEFKMSQRPFRVSFYRKSRNFGGAIIVPFSQPEVA